MTIKQLFGYEGGLIHRLKENKDIKTTNSLKTSYSFIKSFVFRYKKSSACRMEYTLRITTCIPRVSSWKLTDPLPTHSECNA